MRWTLKNGKKDTGIGGKTQQQQGILVPHPTEEGHPDPAFLKSKLATEGKSFLPKQNSLWQKQGSIILLKKDGQLEILPQINSQERFLISH